jgi:pimeloyl-ACP methyl ester carboxylesterase
MPYVNLQGQKIFFAQKVTGKKTPVLLIHGAAGTHLDWPPQLRRLATASVYAIDLPGHGRSPGPAHSTVGQSAAVVSALISELDLNGVVLVGHSMGGAIALRIAHTGAQAIKGLVLISSGARLRVKEELLNGIGSDFDSTAGMVTEWFWSEGAPEELKDLGKRAFLANKQEVVYADYLACNSFDLMDQLNQIELPTLVICGSVDKMTPVKYSRYLAEQMPAARLKIVEGAGHMVHLEQPEKVAFHIKHFLQEISQFNSMA